MDLFIIGGVLGMIFLLYVLNYMLVKYYIDPHDGHWFSTFVISLTLTTALAFTLLIPFDIYLTAFRHQ